MPDTTPTPRPPSQPRDRYTPDFDALVLTTIGSRNVAIAVAPSPFAENPGDATLWLRLHLGPLALALTATQARRLADWLNAVIDTEKRDARP